MIRKDLMDLVGLVRTHATDQDELKFFKKIQQDPGYLNQIVDHLEEGSAPFYRFFSNYGTGIGETIEEMVGEKFTDIIPKTFPKYSKHGVPLKSREKNKVYSEYNRRTGKKPSNYDWLVEVDGAVKSLEVKVIRATEGKIKQETKLYEIPSLLEERVLCFSERHRSGNQSFQQTKAELFDYILGIVLYKDQVDYYLVPSDDIKSGKLKITNQHAGAIKDDGSTNEGHLMVNQLGEYKILSVHDENSMLSPDTLTKYIHDRNLQRY